MVLGRGPRAGGYGSAGAVVHGTSCHWVLGYEDVKQPFCEGACAMPARQVSSCADDGSEIGGCAVAGGAVGAGAGCAVGDCVIAGCDGPADVCAAAAGAKAKAKTNRSEAKHPAQWENELRIGV